MDLAALLRQTDPNLPDTTSADARIDDPLAQHEIHLSLRLRPADTLNERHVLGTIGIAGQMPQFVQGAVAFNDLPAVLRTLYARIEPPQTATESPTEPADTDSTTLATAPPTSAQSSMLDIF